MAAAFLTKQFSHCADITLVESDQIGTVGVGEATIPPLKVFHDLAGIDEKDFMRATQASFKLGIRFDNWARQDDSYFHSFGKTGSGSWAADFHHYYLKAKALNENTELSHYSLETRAANKGLFAKDTRNTLNYAYHLNATAYAKFLREKSEERGLKRVEGIIEAVHLNDQESCVRSVDVESSDHTKLSLQADFFIDCTGHRALLIGGALKTSWNSWSEWLLCDAAVAVQTEAQAEIPPFTVSTAHAVGWQWRIPLQNRVGNGHVYSSQFKSESEAFSTLHAHLESKTITEPISLRFNTGMRSKTWVGNVCALGLANGFIEPLESTSIHMINAVLVRLGQLLPFGHAESEWQTARNSFNKQIEHEWLMVRDFVILHYKLTERDDSEFWRYCRTMPIPETLSERLELFRQTGQFIKSDRELFQIDSWVQVMLGQRFIPSTLHPQVDQLNSSQLDAFLAAIKADKEKILPMLPKHELFIDSYLAH